MAYRCQIFVLHVKQAEERWSLLPLTYCGVDMIFFISL